MPETITTCRASTARDKSYSNTISNANGRQCVDQDSPVRAANVVVSEHSQPFLTILVIDHDAALFNAPLRD